MFRAGLYARVSTNDQQTLPMQSRAMREYAARRGWTIAMQVREVGSGAVEREAREKLTGGRPPPRDRCRAGVAAGPLGPVGNGSAGDTPGTGASRSRFRVADRGAGSDHAGRSRDGRPAGNFRRVRKGNSAGTNSGWPGPCPAERETAGPAGNRGLHAAEIRKLHRAGVSKSEIARRLQIGRTSVRRILGAKS